MTTPEPEFERLVLEHLDGLYNLARWLTRNMDEAQDLVQETALKALKARDQFRGGTTLTAWLYRILRNSFIDRYWKRQREPSGQEGDLPGVLGELEQALEETEIEHLRPLVAADINRALKALPGRRWTGSPWRRSPRSWAARWARFSLAYSGPAECCDSS